MDFKRLRYALAVADEGNFVRAAERVSISQPALTRAIQTLEDELGLVLFDRGNRQVTVTHAGAVFLEHARRLIFGMRNLEHDMRLVRGAHAGELAFGAGPLHTTVTMPRLLKALHEEHPGIRIVAAINNWHNLLANLRAEELEFFVAEVRDLEPADDIMITPLCRQLGGFYCRPGHPLAGQTITLADALPFGLASTRFPRAIDTTMRRLFRLGPNQPLPIAVQCDSVELLSRVVNESNLILMISHAAASGPSHLGLVRLETSDLPPMGAEVGVVQLRGRTLSPAAQLALAKLRAIQAELPETELYTAPAL